VKEFVNFYLRRSELVEEAKYIKMNTRNTNEQREKFDNYLKELGK